ncbi:serine--tRNA ligase [Mesorhizobium sp. A556]
MLDIKWIRDNPKVLVEALEKRFWSTGDAQSTVDDLIAKDEARREHLTRLQSSQERRNAASKEIGNAMRNGDAALAEKLKSEVGEIKEFIQNGEARERELDKALNDALAVLPNVPLEEVPVGKDEHANVERRRFGDDLIAKRQPRMGNKPKEHFELGEALGMMDFERAAKLSGSRFTVLKGQLARLERAIGQFMLDLHTTEHGYQEVQVPLMVREEALFGTGQLPKFREDLYPVLNRYEQLKVENRALGFSMEAFAQENTWLAEFTRNFDVEMRKKISAELDVRWTSKLFESLSIHFGGSAKRFHEFETKFRSIAGELSDLVARGETGAMLIPTAEVPLTNLVREEITAHEKLPLRMTALTPCFRSEAGSAGRDTRGMLRQHQFYKVELVSITDAESSIAEHERMTECAEAVLKKLELPFRTMTLCTGDMGFGAKKTYDIEVWLPGQNAYREISSCSVCGDFQARRMDARYKVKDEKATRFVHTLNGSGTAVGRALIAVMENYQNEDGSVTIPEALRPYMGGVERIESK